MKYHYPYKLIIKVLGLPFIGAMCAVGLLMLNTASGNTSLRNRARKTGVTDTLIAVADPLHPDYKKDSLKDWEQKFTDFEFRVYKSKGQELPYRLHHPVKIEMKKKYPLVLFFHGAGERGLDNRIQFLRFAPTVAFWKDHPCYVLAPLCPPTAVTEDGVWVKTSFGAASHEMKGTPTWPMQLSMDLLNKLIKKNKIDTDRIYVTGLSMGGFATWEILQREPGRVAAAIPVCGGADLAYSSVLSKIPLWVFHGDNDKVVPVNRSRDMVNAIRSNGGSPKYTEYPGVGHDCWGRTYSNHEIWDWLFKQTKSNHIKE